MTALTRLRAACIEGVPVELQLADGTATTSIKDATQAKIGRDGKVYALDEVTEFYNEDSPQTLRAVVFCWFHDKSSIVDYRAACLENGIPDFKFLVKTELSTWLSGRSDASEFVRPATAAPRQESRDQPPAAAATAANGGGAAPATASTASKRSFELDSIDHNAALRGSKNIDFGYLVSDAKRLISQLKKAKPESAGSRPSSRLSSAGGTKKQPIIIISPATTSLITLTNIKEFLENGHFVDPSEVVTRKPASGIVTLEHASERLAPSAHRVMVVDNVDIFTKPEYWDRVVGIFTTGQTWQFAKYKWPKPEELFQHYAGFYVSYSGDVVPRQIAEWNLTEIRVDRGDKRFRDKMIVKDLWAVLEKAMIAKGYGRH
ncbi:Cell division control protein 73 C-terminal domain-containing protein [[Candida] zeylanoides]